MSYIMKEKNFNLKKFFKKHRGFYVIIDKKCLSIIHDGIIINTHFIAIDDFFAVEYNNYEYVAKWSDIKDNYELSIKRIRDFYLISVFVNDEECMRIDMAKDIINKNKKRGS